MIEILIKRFGAKRQKHESEREFTKKNCIWCLQSSSNYLKIISEYIALQIVVSRGVNDDSHLFVKFEIAMPHFNLKGIRTLNRDKNEGAPLKSTVENRYKG